MTTVYQLPLFASEKRCTQCKETLPLDAFSRCRNNPDGRQSQCKVCRTAYMLAWRQENFDRQKAYGRLYKAKHKDQDAARRRERYATDAAYREKVKGRVHAWRTADPERTKERRRASYYRHRETILDYWRKRYRSNPAPMKARAAAWEREHPDRKRTRRRAYYETHRAEFRERNRQRRRMHRDLLNAQARAWKKTHPPDPLKVREWCHRRRARLLAAEGRYTAADIRALERLQAGLCYYCQQPYGRYEIDHKQPLSRGGSNWPANLCLACPPCNARKHNRTEAEFFAVLARGD